MGRRLNVSTPTVINTELVPLDESFYLDVDGQMEQWYYDNTEQYAPNRKVTPLLLVPVISAFDKDTSTSYTPTFNTTQWFANEWNETQGKYVETEITNQVDSGSADYVIQGNNLLVKKNVSYSHAVSIRCVATYIDPRDRGVTYAVEDSVNLTTNRTADVVFPEVDIISPSGRAYNPLVDDENSQYDFKGVTTNNPVQPLNSDVRRYGVDVDGTEEILNSGEAVAPIMDIRYGNNPTMADQEFMYRQTAGGTLVGESINKAYIERIKGNTVAWNQILDIEGSGNSFITMSNGYIHVHAGTATSYAYVQISGVDINFIPNHKYCVVGINKYCDLANGDSACLHIPRASWPSASEMKNDGIFTCNNGVNSSVYVYYTAGTVFSDGTFSILFFDLTLIYGAGNEPATPEEFEADYERWFGKPLAYEEYDEGSLRPVLMQSIKTTWFNQWDEEWRVGYYRDTDGGFEAGGVNLATKNPIKVIPNSNYYFYKTQGTKGHGLFYYDSNMNFIGNSDAILSNHVFTTPSNAHYINFYIWSEDTYNNNICINISNPSKNGTYEPYEENVQGFDVTAIKGKLDGAGESVTIFPDGLKKAGNIQDEIFVEDGVIKAIKRVGSVDLGSLEWITLGQEEGSFRAVITNMSQTENTIVAICSKYSASVEPNGYNIYYATEDKVFVTNAGYGGGPGLFAFRDTAFANYTTSQVAAALRGVKLIYELAEPQTYVLDPITDFVWYGINDGQEVLADTLPWYVSGQGTDNLTVDAMYGENINVVLRCKMMDGETLSPSKAYATLNWRTPDIETFVQSDNGGAVRSDTEEMSFGTIVNVNGDVLSDALKQKHLAFNWKIRKNNTSTETNKGWGQRITIDASDLRNVKGSGSTLASTLVSNEVYLKGAYEEVTDNGEVVTDGGEVVYDRPVD